MPSSDMGEAETGRPRGRKREGVEGVALSWDRRRWSSGQKVRENDRDRGKRIRNKEQKERAETEERGARAYV